MGGRTRSPSTPTSSGAEMVRDDVPEPVFSVLRRGKRQTRWERGFDPLTTVEAEMRHDDVGRALQTVQIAVPRRRDPYRDDNQAQSYLATCTRRRFAGPMAGRIRDRVAHECTYDVRASTPAVPKLLADLESADLPLRLIGAQVSRYDGKPFEGLDVGELGDHGLLTRRERLVHTLESLAAAFRLHAQHDGDGAPVPWLNPDSVPADWQGYPPEFKAALTEYGGRTEYGDSGGFMWQSVNAEQPAGLWAIDVAYQYDLQKADDGFGLVVGERRGWHTYRLTSFPTLSRYTPEPLHDLTD